MNVLKSFERVAPSTTSVVITCVHNQTKPEDYRPRQRLSLMDSGLYALWLQSNGFNERNSKDSAKSLEENAIVHTRD